MPEHTDETDEPTDELPEEAPAELREADEERIPDIPEDAVDEVERLTRLARNAVDEAEAEAYRDRRADIVAEHDYELRIREGDDTLVCYPAEWLVDGEVQLDRVANTDRAVEVSLSGPGNADQWTETDTHNRELVEELEDEYGSVHAANASALADFMSNHYAKPMEEATAAELAEFVEEYYPRNAWPSAEQREKLDETLDLVFDAADRERPTFRAERR